MTETPISAFLDEYRKKNAVRLHMPGHKGAGGIAEELDITEIDGADSLFEASGIIKESEKIAGNIFGADTFYSTEGSSLSIRAMLYLISLYAKRTGRNAIIAAARNAHKAFTSTAALLDFSVDWICSENSSYISSGINRDDTVRYFENAKVMPVALYLTSPDYLGFMCDIKAIAEECQRRDVLLVVDNAHGSYLKFLAPSIHPIDLGADMCCDSAHKTLDALTGCSYLHISKSAPVFFKEHAKEAMMLFASTSPSYLLLNSLDRLNASLSGNYKERILNFTKKITCLKADLVSHGYFLAGDEPMKITVAAKKYGYSGTEISTYLSSLGIFAEFSDPDYLVLMPSPQNSDKELDCLKNALTSLPKKNVITESAPSVHIPKTACSIREALMSDSEELRISECVGRVAAALTAGCPPAIPIAVPGEIIDEKILDVFKYYGITKFKVIRTKKG